MAPTTQKVWTVAGKTKGFAELSLKEAEVPKVGDYEVLVKLEGASLNYRDLIIPQVSRRIVCPLFFFLPRAVSTSIDHYIYCRENTPSRLTSLLFLAPTVQAQLSRSVPRSHDSRRATRSSLYSTRDTSTALSTPMAPRPVWEVSTMEPCASTVPSTSRVFLSLLRTSTLLSQPL